MVFFYVGFYELNSIPTLRVGNVTLAEICKQKVKAYFKFITRDNIWLRHLPNSLNQVVGGIATLSNSHNSLIIANLDTSAFSLSMELISWSGLPSRIDTECSFFTD